MIRYQRPQDLTAHFDDDGRITIRSESLNVGAKVPPFICAVLAFCSQPRKRNEILHHLGPQVQSLLDQLIEIGLLTSPEQASNTQMTTNFSDINIHRRMLADSGRLEAYRSAIQRAVQPGMVVIDAGAGSGILSVYAAQAGAARVYAVESNEFASRIGHIAKANQVDDIVRVVQADFGRVQLPEKADVLVTETFGVWALAEGAAADLSRCVQRNLKPDGILLPDSVSLFIAPLITLPPAILSPFQHRFDGVDLSFLLPSARTRSFNILLQDEPCEPQLIQTLPITENTVNSSLHLASPCDGLALWFDLHFPSQQTLSTGPAAPPTHWKQSLLAVELTAGEYSIQAQPAASDRRGCQLHVGAHSFLLR